jgi:hypothetical protein
MSVDASVIEGEVIEKNEALEVRGTPETLEQIAALGDGGNEIVRARIQVLTTLRKASIQATNPEDWLLFRAEDKRDMSERIVGYLQDAGCDRVASLWGIEIFGIDKPERIMANDGTANFMYLIRGSGRCSITRQTVEQIEGGRSSADDFCKDKTGTALELATRKAARANLDGNIVRELTGLKSVPLEQLRDAWEGSKKNWQNCVKGRGFGKAEGNGGPTGAALDMSIPVPKCPKCSGQMWDNRTSKKSPRAPDFKCKDKDNCDGALWVDKLPKQSPAQESRPATNGGGEGVVLNGVKFPADCKAPKTNSILLASMDEEARRAGINLYQFTWGNLNVKPNEMNDEAARQAVEVLRAMPDRGEE